MHSNQLIRHSCFRQLEDLDYAYVSFDFESLDSGYKTHDSGYKTHDEFYRSLIIDGRDRKELGTKLDQFKLSVRKLDYLLSGDYQLDRVAIFSNFKIHVDCDVSIKIGMATNMWREYINNLSESDLYQLLLTFTNTVSLSTKRDIHIVNMNLDIDISTCTRTIKIKEYFFANMENLNLLTEYFRLDDTIVEKNYAATEMRIIPLVNSRTIPRYSLTVIPFSTIFNHVTETIHTEGEENETQNENRYSLIISPSFEDMFSTPRYFNRESNNNMSFIDNYSALFRAALGMLTYRNDFDEDIVNFIELCNNISFDVNPHSSWNIDLVRRGRGIRGSRWRYIESCLHPNTGNQ